MTYPLPKKKIGDLGIGSIGYYRGNTHIVGINRPQWIRVEIVEPIPTQRQNHSSCLLTQILGNIPLLWNNKTNNDSIIWNVTNDLEIYVLKEGKYND